MGWTAFNRYRDRWVLCSKARVLGGAEIDVEPVRLINATQVDELTSNLRQLLTEQLPDVQPPDLNDPRNVLGLRAKAVGAKTWRTFHNAARTFILREEAEALILEEWPKDGGKPIWKKVFPVGMVHEAVRHAIRLTEPSDRKAAKKARQ
jgi:hypothetical protein